MRDLLFLAHRIPYPPDKGDKIRSWHILERLAKRYRVHLGCAIDDPRDHAHTAMLRALCADCCFVDLNPTVAKARSLTGLLAGGPLTLPYYYDRKLAAWADAVIARQRPQRVFVYSSAMAQYAEAALGGATRAVIDFCDVDSEKWREYAAKIRGPKAWIYRREADKLLAFERRMAARFDYSLFVSAAEAALFRRLAPEVAGRVGHVDNGVDCDNFSPDRRYENPFPADSRAVVFTGAMDYWPNAGAVKFYAEAVLPRVRQRAPGTRFVIVGSNPTAAVRALAALPGVEVTGRVPDVRPYLAHAALVVVPLQIARGVQNKLLEAMAMAKAVVASSKAAAGVGAIPANALLVADTAADFAAATLAVMEPGRAPAIGAAARRFVLEHFGWRANLDRLEDILEGQRVDA
jgi:sugar transferase (PEP-CTERM/EpsH1 system associated)